MNKVHFIIDILNLLIDSMNSSLGITISRIPSNNNIEDLRV